MSTYITLDHIQVQNANCVAGLTFGFPAVTHFLGYVHALSRKLTQSHNISLHGCAIACHQHQVHAYKPKGYGDYIFSLTRNPLTRTGATASITEEGKMHMTVSLVIKCEGLIAGGEEGVALLVQHLKKICLMQKLAGGVINSVKDIHIESAQTDDEHERLSRKIRRRLLPGFLLLDRSQYLNEHCAHLQQTNPNSNLFDAWLDFVTLKFKAEPSLTQNEDLSDKTKADWAYIHKPKAGYLVPLAVGYRAISEVLPHGTLSETRDSAMPFCFVESAYGLGEWQSPHRTENIDNALWNYQTKEGWYLCAGLDSVDLDGTDNDIEDDDYGFL